MHMAGGDGGEVRNECVMRYVGARYGILGCDAARHVATKAVGGLVCVYGGGCRLWAGESSRGTAKTPPLQSALRGGRCGVLPSTFNGNGVNGDHDAARRVATSSEKRENRF